MLYFLTSEASSAYSPRNLSLLANAPRSDDHLALAIEDLRLAAEVGLGGASLTQALLRRSASAKLMDLTSSEADLNEALTSIRLVADATLADRLTRQVKASLLDCNVRKALNGSDTRELLETCAALLSCGEEASRYSLTVVNAARALLKWSEGALQEVRDTAEAVLVLVDSYVATITPNHEHFGHLERLSWWYFTANSMPAWYRSAP